MQLSQNQNIFSEIFAAFTDSIQNLEYFEEKDQCQTRWKVFSLSKSEGLTEPIQMQLSQNENIFSEIFSAFTDSIQNLEYFEEKDQCQSWFLSEVKDCKSRFS